MDSDVPAPQPDAMTPLGQVLAERMERRGWSAREVERRGGPAASTINRLISSDPKDNRNPPNEANLRKLAQVLVIPLARLERAADETRGRTLPAPVHEAHVETIVAALAGLDQASQETVTEVVVMITDRIRAAVDATGALPHGAPTKTAPTRQAAPKRTPALKDYTLASRTGQPDLDVPRAQQDRDAEASQDPDE